MNPAREKPTLKARTLSEPFVRSLFSLYPLDVHKGDFGRVFILAGSVGMTGAAALCGSAAIRSGAGLVTVGVPASLNDILEVKLTEAMTLPLPEGPNRNIGVQALKLALDFAAQCDVVALGPGLSMEGETVDFVQDFVSHCEKPLLIDADALNALALAPGILKKAPGPTIITPHPGEMARLLSSSVKEVQTDRLAAIIKATESFNCITLLKGAKTLVSDGTSIWINPTGNPGMATGGSGDVLTGMIAAFVARGLKVLDAALAGAYLHGLAGDLASGEKGEVSLIASDIIDFIPQAIKSGFKGKF